MKILDLFLTMAMAIAMAMAMARPFGARRAGPPLPGVERKYWKSSQENNIFFDKKRPPWKNTFFVEKRISPYRTLWNLSRMTDLEKSMPTDLAPIFFESKSSESWKILWKSQNLGHIFFQPFILYGFWVYFNLLPLPSL